MASIAQGRRLLADPSQAVITDCNIADEIGEAFGASYARGYQLDFRERGHNDSIAEDTNIDDMKKQLQQ